MVATVPRGFQIEDVVYRFYIQTLLRNQGLGTFPSKHFEQQEEVTSGLKKDDPANAKGAVIESNKEKVKGISTGKPEYFDSGEVQRCSEKCED